MLRAIKIKKKKLKTPNSPRPATVWPQPSSQPRRGYDALQLPDGLWAAIVCGTQLLKKKKSFSTPPVFGCHRK
jgi:hypothetical protein